jgi:hypothetical protein
MAPATPPPPPSLPPHDAPRQIPWSIAVLGAVSYASDDSLWFDATALACADLGPFCIGGLVRAAFDSAETGASARVETNRVALDVLATVELPVRWPRFSLTPGIGVGGGWIRSISDVDQAPADTEEVDRGTLRFDAHVRFAAALTETLWLDLGLFADVSPLAHTARFVDDGVMLAGEPRGPLRAGAGLRYEVR